MGRGVGEQTLFRVMSCEGAALGVSAASSSSTPSLPPLILGGEGVDLAKPHAGWGVGLEGGDPELRYRRFGNDAGKNYNLNLDNLDDVGWIQGFPQVRAVEETALHLRTRRRRQCHPASS